jgi:formate hydrogenlyase subunit 6/NADH:ubiquinone oxidoreductase subunit I
MSLVYFIEGPLLWIAFSVFIFAIIFRVTVFTYTTIRKSGNRAHRGLYLLTTLLRSLLPFHIGAKKRPLYAAIRYIFHLSLFMLPIWYSGHISMWEMSRFELSWRAVPDALADWMTIIALALLVVFLIRRLLIPRIRRTSGVSDWALVILTALPFISGAMLVHANLPANSFIDHNIFTIHVLTGEIMLIMTAFLFCRIRMNDLICTGCAACEINCSTEALEAMEGEAERFFTYTPYQCIQCGECAGTCPDGAVELRHKISLRDLFKVKSRDEIRSVALYLCARCKKPFAPMPQVEKIADMITAFPVNLCNDCKEMEYAETLHAKNLANGGR